MGPGTAGILPATAGRPGDLARCPQARRPAGRMPAVPGASGPGQSPISLRPMAPFDAFTAAVRTRGPRVAVVLGSGLGAVPHRFTELASIPFADVPGLVAPSILGHSGAIGLGRCTGIPLLVFRGR